MTTFDPSQLALADLRWLQRFATALASSGDDADDLVQETLVEAWAHEPDVQDRPLRPWLASVLRNRFRMLTRGQRRRTQREAQAVASAEPKSAEQVHARLEVLERLVHEIRTLPETQQVLIVRRFFAGESPTEIGRSLNVPAATIRSKLHRSLQRLRTGLDEKFGDRSTWAVVVAGVPMVGPAATPPIPAGSPTMSITIKIAALCAATTATAGGALWMGATPKQNTVAAHTAATATEATQSKPRSETPVATWSVRRSKIRAALEAQPEGIGDATPDVDYFEGKEELVDNVNEVFAECLADIGEEEASALTLLQHHHYWN